jgi:diphthine synthase
MLTFVGLGLYDERSITIEGRDALRDADRVFAEFYTSHLAGTTVTDLEAFHDTDIEVLDRTGTERDPEPVLGAARESETVFLVAGDPMISTTHVDLRLRATEQGIDTRVVHGTTAQTAASSLTGLQNYRFGKATTLPFAYGGSGVPESVLTTIAGNRDRGLHTLCYLDIDAEREAYMSADDAARRLADAFEETERFDTGGERPRGTLAVGIARAGSSEPIVRADQLSALGSVDFGDPLHLLVVPGDLHHLEADALEALAGAPGALLRSYRAR